MRKIPLACTIFLMVAGLISSPAQSAEKSQPVTLSVASKPENNSQDVLTLYGGPKTRTPLVEWYLEELNVPYKYVDIDISKGENHQAKFLAINPMGKLPVLKNKDFILWESGAILFYLSEKYSQDSSSLEQSSTINQWIIFANATLSPALYLKENREKEMPNLLTVLNTILESKSFLIGDKLTAADIAVASYLYYSQNLLSLDYSPYPAVMTYLTRMSDRPAFKKTLGKRFEKN